MSTPAPQHRADRGRPLIALTIVLTGWVVTRIASIDGIWPPTLLPGPAGPVMAAAEPSQPVGMTPPPPHHARFDVWQPAVGEPDTASPLFERRTAARARPLRVDEPSMPSSNLPIAGPFTPRAAVRDFAPPPIAAASATPFARPMAERDRWSASSWVFARGGRGTSFAGSGQYGGSQAGAMLRYAITASSSHRAEAHVRITAALEGDRQAELALGGSVKPLPGLPVRLYVEQRLGLNGGSRDRSVAMVVTELAPLRMPAGFEAEVYGQAGLAGVDDHIAFFDLQAVADRPVARTNGVEVRLGAGAWAGGQQGDGPQDGVARLDVGPRASVRFNLGDKPARLALDWRQRVAGDAAPGSGPALTLASDF